MHSCFSQDPNTLKPSPHPTAGARFPLDLAGILLQNHSSSLIDLPFFPVSIFQANFGTAIPPPSHNAAVFPEFPPPPNLSEHTWSDIPRKRHADRTGQSPIFLGSYLNNSCTGKNKQTNRFPCLEHLIYFQEGGKNRFRNSLAWKTHPKWVPNPVPTSVQHPGWFFCCPSP